MTTAQLKVYSGRIPPVSRLARVACGLIALSIAASVMNNRSYTTGGVSLIWLANGFLIGVLLCSPKRQWPVFVGLGYAIDVTLNLTQIHGLMTPVYFSFCNACEVLVAASLMYPALSRDPDLTEARQLRSLLLNGVLLAPAITSTLVTAYQHFVLGASFLLAFRSWFAADALGIALTTPLYLSAFYGRKFSPRSRLEVAGLFLLLFLVSLGVFRLAHYPMLWAVLLFLLLLGSRLGFTGSALGLVLVTFIGGYFTVEGYGPLGPSIASIAVRVSIFQLFICLSMLALYMTEVVMSSNRRVVRRLEASETRFRSLAETSRDGIILTELNGKRKYVSPAMTELLGWDREELMEQHYTRIVHDDDVPRLQEFMQELRDGGGMNPLAYRCRKRSGSYLWLEATARLLRDPQTEDPYGYVYVLRDISDRKAAEEQMQEAFHTVERLAMMDGLTGVANRRLLDQTLAREWISSRRDGLPLSVLLIDVDCFKAFNDQYGHLEGDECLCKVSAKMQKALRRPLDLLARYGGEEFVAVLPNTPIEGAEAIADLVRKEVADCDIPHAGSPHGVVTVSVGCATEIPSNDSSVSSLLNAADAALYMAKSNGRNRTEVAGIAGMSLQ